DERSGRLGAFALAADGFVRELINIQSALGCVREAQQLLAYVASPEQGQDVGGGIGFHERRRLREQLATHWRGDRRRSRTRIGSVVFASPIAGAEECEADGQRE